MRVIEAAYVEGRRRPILTIDGEPVPEHWSITAHLALNRPSQIFINGVRVTEPTRLVRRGIVVAEDGHPDADSRIETLLREAVTDNRAPLDWGTPAPGLTPEAFERAVERVTNQTLEPYIPVHHPRCPAVSGPEPRPDLCSWMGGACG